MKKKMFALTLAAMMALSLAACGGDAPASEPAPDAAGSDAPSIETEVAPDLLATEVNGLVIGFPEYLAYVKSSDAGDAVFANDPPTIAVTVSAKYEQAITPEDITQDVFVQSLASLSDMTMSDIAVAEQIGGTGVVVVGTGTLSNGTEMNYAAQFYIFEDGSGYNFISYLYGMDDTDFDDQLTTILASVSAAE